MAKVESMVGRYNPLPVRRSGLTPNRYTVAFIWQMRFAASYVQLSLQEGRRYYEIILCYTDPLHHSHGM